jgi:hypothetical protein
MQMILKPARDHVHKEQTGRDYKSQPVYESRTYAAWRRLTHDPFMPAALSVAGPGIVLFFTAVHGDRLKEKHATVFLYENFAPVNEILFSLAVRFRNSVQHFLRRLFGCEEAEMPVIFFFIQPFRRPDVFNVHGFSPSGVLYNPLLKLQNSNLLSTSKKSKERTQADPF